MKQENVNRILSATPKIYNAIASDFSDTRGSSPAGGLWGLGDFAKYAKAGDRILDLGCGNGRMAQLFENMDVEYLGLDNSEELIEIARDRYMGKMWARFEMCDALTIENCKLSAKGGSALGGKIENYNLVLMIAVLHHIPTKELRLKALKNAYDVLQPGGRLIISNWNLWKIGGRKKFRYWPYLLDYRQKARFGAYNPSDAFVPWKANLRQSEWHARYIHSYGKSEMKNLLKKAGFAAESVKFTSKNSDSASIITGDNLLAVAVKK